MPHSIKKTSETVASLLITSYSTAFTLAITKLTAKTYTWGQATSDVSVSTLDGTLTDNGNATYVMTAAGTYPITFANDGVYKLTIVDVTTTYVNYTLINSTLKGLLKTQITNNIYCHPEVAYDCSDKIEAVYNTNILSILSNSYFSGEDINIAFDYSDMTSGILHEGYQYECTNAGTGTRDFAAGAVLLLMDDNFNLIAASTALTLGETYTCIITGTPDTWGSTTLKPMNTLLINRLRTVADAVDRVDEYSDSCATKNTCPC